MKERPLWLEFLDLAQAEYDALQRYCNSMARISHVAAVPHHQPQQQQLGSSSPENSISSSSSSTTTTTAYVDLRTLLAQQYLAERGCPLTISSSSSSLSFADTYRDCKNRDSSLVLQEAMKEYYKALELLRSCHTQLIQFISDQHQTTTTGIHKKNVSQQENSCMITQPILQWMMEYKDLSCRVLKTCASSSTSKGFGPFYDNGILKDLNGNDDSMNQSWHHVRIVSLATLQASIVRIRRNLFEIYKDHV